MANEKSYLVFFLEDRQSGSAHSKSSFGIVLNTGTVWFLSFPFDCLVFSEDISFHGEDGKIGFDSAGSSQELEFLGSLKFNLNYSRVRLPSGKYKGAVLPDLVRIAAVLGRCEESGIYLDDSSVLSLGYMSRYTKVGIIDLFSAKEIRDRFDGLRARTIRMASIRRNLQLGWKSLGFSKKQEKLESEFEELYEPFSESVEAVTDIYEELKEKIAEKKFLVWEMIAEYTIVILISFELLIAVVEYFGD